jgi:choline dehydrogenase-like flavoprotein
MEQTPDPGNRVQLSTERDRFGQRRAELVFRLTDEDRRRHGRSLSVVAGAIGLDGPRVAGAAEAVLREGRAGFFSHHMGTTRMHEDPRQGVVDANCRVNGVSNLFVAGSSVFPTGGTTGPTLTIVALAVRLARHLRRGHL